MPFTVTAVSSLEAFFKQPVGASRPGVDWAIRISGDRTASLIVRTYFVGNSPRKAELPALQAHAENQVRQRLESGWTPDDSGFLLVEEPAPQLSPATRRPWWKFFGS